jgi:mannose-6-phosphate isomerase
MIVRVPSNRPPERFYRGGARITAFRGEPPAAEYEPEDWVGSTTTVFGDPALGLTRLPDGRLLRDAIEADPLGWLGPAHVGRWGADLRLLVKLLDAGQRLPVHAHPDDVFADRHLGHAHGKAEAWYILEGGTVHVGLTRDVVTEELATLVADQDVTALLAVLHAVEVAPGDVVWVPPGELHAIGAGVLLLELQQPEDLSVLLEWQGFAIDGARAGHLGLGFELALQAVNRSARTAQQVRALIRTAPADGSVLPPDADRYFRLERLAIDDSRQVAPGFAILVITRGELVLGDVPAPSGSTFLLPAAEGPIAVRGPGELLIARPPSP